MIGRLKGVLAEKSVENVVIDVGGVGYDVRCPLSVLDRLPRAGEPCQLSIHTHVREDQLTLYGFMDGEERRLFRLLITVSGVGPKLGLACLSGLRGEDLARAIVDADVKRLASIPGIGKRTAERLVVELRDKLQAVMPAGAAGLSRTAAIDDLDSALRNLGYRTKDVDQLIAGLAAEADGMSFEALLREALRRLNKST